MSRAFDTIDRGIFLNDLKQILNSDTLHLISLLLKDVQIQVKHKNELDKIFTPDIGSLHRVIVPVLSGISFIYTKRYKHKNYHHIETRNRMLHMITTTQKKSQKVYNAKKTKSISYRATIR